MALDNSAITLTLDPETTQTLASLASQTQQSVSATAAKLIREALELHEDAWLSAHGDKCLAETTEWVSHEDAWGAVKGN